MRQWMQAPLWALVMTWALAGCAAQSTRQAAPDTDESASLMPPGASAPESEPEDYSYNPDDPWEGFNRKMHGFNDVFDRYLLRPVALGYSKVTPRFVRKGVSNFFGNLQQPLSAFNLLLQGRPGQAGTALGRFTLNTVVGLGGLLDPASDAGIPYRKSDFGQTLARWGWKDSRYLVLPIFGPGTVRDNMGKGVHTTISPVSWLARREGAEVSILYGLDARAAALPYESFLEGAADPYLLIRDAYMQRRRCQITDCSTEMPDYLMPDYEFEVPDFETLRR